MAFTLLHLSDVHFGPHCQVTGRDAASAGSELARKLAHDLKVRSSASLDAIVASGDFTWTNDPHEFECALAFLRDLARAFGLSTRDIVVVPGNHDITWSAMDPTLSDGFKYLLAQEAEGRYRKFVHDLLGIRLGELLTTIRVFHKSKVAILGLDSCRLPNKQDAGLGYVGRDQVERGIAMLRALPAYQSNEQSFFKIAVLHHHLLPALDLDLSLLRRQPADRQFTLTLDAASVVKLLLVDNFALVLHGHLHVPFGSVERRVWGPIGSLEPNPSAALAVTAAGSLSVKAPHADRNEYQVITIDDQRVHFRVVSGLFGTLREERVFQLSRRELTRPVTNLPLAPESQRATDQHRSRLVESEILAERLARREPGLTDVVFALVAMRAPAIEPLRSLDRVRLRELFDDVVRSWWSGPDPKSRYDRAAARQGVTFPEYVLRLMIALRGHF